MSSCLLIQTLKHFEIPSNIKIYDFLDNIFVYYSEAESKVELYDINTFALTSLDHLIAKTKSDLTSIKISPSHSLIAFGFSDGKIFLYSTLSQKVTKIKTKQKSIPVVCMCFISDNLLISSTDDSKLTGYRITFNRFGVTYKDFPITTLLETANALVAPPIYQYISDTTLPRCLSSLIEGIFIYKTSNNFAICKITDKFQVLIELSNPQCIFCFSPVYNDEVNVGLATQKTIEIYKITKDRKIELIYFYEINLTPSFIMFFAPTIFLVNFDDVKCYVFSIEKLTDSNKSTKENFLDSISEIHNENIPEKGYLFTGRNILYLFGSENTYKISMITFFDIINRYKKEGKFNEIIDFCKKAISGDYKATIGLPLNPVQKSIKIEESISQTLNQKCQEDLNDPAKTPYSTANNFILLSKELGLKNWVITNALKYFQSKGFLNDYFKAIINSDPDANLFFYNKDWALTLLENIDTLDASKFLLSLPKKVVPNNILIQVAKKKNDIDLLVDILIYKMNDYVDAAAVIWNSGNNEKLSRMYNSFLYPSTSDIQISVSLISWLFGVKKIKDTNNDNAEGQENENKNKSSYSFPHLNSLLEFNDQITIEVLIKIKQFITKYKRPFTLTEFTNAILLTMQNNHELEITDKVMDILEEIIIDSKIKIAKENLKIIFSRIFTNKTPAEDHHDNRQALLLIIINENVSKEFNELLLPLCDNFGFRFAKKCIYILNQEFERAFKEVICNPDDNIFQFIKQTIRSHSSSKEQIGDAVLSIAPYLIKNDIAEFYLILKNYFPDLVPKVISSLTDEDALRNYYIKYLIKFQDISEMNLPKNTLISFCKFLCQYYPDDVKTFLESEKNSLTDFYQICKNYKIFDACAIIANYTNDIKSFILYISHYFTLKMIAFVDSDEKGDQEDAIYQFGKCFDFVLSKLENSISRNSGFPEIEDLCKSIVECFILPFYALQVDQKQFQNSQSKIPKIPVSEVPEKLTQLQQKRVQLNIAKIETKRTVSDNNQVPNGQATNSDFSSDSDDDIKSKIQNNNSSMKISKSEVYSKTSLSSSLSGKHKPIATTSSASTANSNQNQNTKNTPNEHLLFMQKKAEILSTDMMKICISVSKILSYPVLLTHLTSKFENIYIEYTRKSYLALINDAAYDLQTTTALAQLFHQDERNTHDKFILKHLHGIVCHAQSMTRCGTCGGALNGINNLIRIFPCGHAFHDNPKCLPKQICPICNPEVRIDQDIRRPTFAIQGNQAQRLIKKFELKLNKKIIEENDNCDESATYVPKKGSIRIKSVPVSLPAPAHE